jgi:hypothetical protein
MKKKREKNAEENRNVSTDDVTAPIWKFVVDYPDIFERHVLKSGYLNGTDLKFFYGTNTDTRLAIKRANIELQKKFKIEEMSSISQLEPESCSNEQTRISRLVTRSEEL